MKILRWVIIILAVLNFGFMTVDGSRALIVGDYFRTQTGEYAGQLGPWAALVSAIGINPESVFMKCTFLLWGTLGLVFTVSFAMRVRRADNTMLFLNIASFWYLVVGTLSSVIQVILLLILRFINKRS